MQHTRFSAQPCPAARALDSVGDWWSILIVRDAFRGISRFDAFQKSLGIAPNILSRRLTHLCEQGVLEKRPYQTRPPRYSYHLTDKGQGFFPVLMALADWGNRYLPIDPPTWQITDRATARPLTVQVVRADTLAVLTPQTVALATRLPDGRIVPHPSPGQPEESC